MNGYEEGECFFTVIKLFNIYFVNSFMILIFNDSRKKTTERPRWIYYNIRYNS